MRFQEAVAVSEVLPVKFKLAEWLCVGICAVVKASVLVPPVSPSKSNSV